MKIKFSYDFYFLMNEIIDFIAKDKPIAARKFKKELISAIKKDLKFPYNYKKSFYFEENSFRDYTHKGYTITFKVNEAQQLVIVVGIIKNKYSY
jgi:plasmid stabilization system protein ParE